MEQKSNQNQNGADYLFEAGSLPDGVDIAGFAGTGDQNLFAGNDGNSDYSLVGDASEADVIISNNRPSSGNGTTGTGGSNGNGGNNGGSNGNGGNNGGSNGNGNNVTPDPTPTPDPSSDSDISNPDTDKQLPNPGWDFTVGVYNESVIPLQDADGNIDSNAVVIRKAYNVEGAEVLYYGQKITKKATYVIGQDRALYAWTDAAYGKYIRIDGVSFDGGKPGRQIFR